MVNAARQGRHRGLLQINVRARSQGEGGQSEVRTERRRNHHHVHRAHCGECLAQIGVQIYAVDGGWVEDDAGVDGRNQFDEALIREPGDPLGARRCSGKVHPLPGPSTRSTCKP